MRIFSKHLVALAAGSLVGAACAGGDSGNQTTSKPVATVTGSLSSDGGNQNVNPAMHPTASGSLRGQVNAVSIATIGPTGELTAIAAGSVAADGTFRIDNVPVGNGPFIVEGQGSAGVIGSVIVPGDLAADDTVQTVPMSAETTLEANVLASLAAGGEAPANVDTIGLMTWISAELAADAQSTGSVANAVADAQTAWLQVAVAGSANVTASALVDAKLAAWTELTAALNGAQSDVAEASAWADFMAEAQADVAAQAHVDLATQAQATAAAGVLFQAAFAEGTAAADDATAIAAVLSAHADAATQAAATSGSTAISAQLDAAYQAFIDAVGSAGTVDAVAAAYVNLAATISGSGSGNADGSIAASLAAQAGSTITFDAMEAAILGAAQASVDLRSSIGTALASGERETRVSGVVQSYTAFGAAVEAAVAAHLGANAPDWATGFVASAAAQAGGHGAVLLDLDILSVVTGGSGIDIVGAVTASLGLQSGADGLVDGVFTASADAMTAILVTVNPQGTTHTVATGTLDANGMFHFEDVTAATTSATFVQLLDAQGAVVGAVQLEGVLSGQGDDVTAPPMTAETTAEAEVFIAIVADGMAESSIDRAFLEAHIDAAMAAAMASEGNVSTVATAIEVASQVHAQALGTTTTALATASASVLAQLHADLAANGEAADQAYADFQAALAAAIEGTVGADASEQAWATAQASATFTAIIEGGSDAGSDLAATAEARGHLASSAMLDLAVSGAFEQASFGAARVNEIHAAVAAYAMAIGDAQNAGQLDLAGDAFVDAMLGLGGLDGAASGVLGLVVSSDLDLNALDQASVATAVQSAFAAAATWQAGIEAAAALTGSGSGTLDLHAAVAAIATATSTFDGALDAALDLSVIASLAGSDASALHALVVQLSAGLYGSTSGGASSP